jgi:FkbM family methyltransferase
MYIINTIKFIISHPLNKNNKLIALNRFFKWQLSSFLNPYPIIYSFVEDTKMIIWKGLSGATGNLYCGLHEFQDMSFVLHCLRREDTFIDIGANIGSYTLLASGVIGTNTIAVEPIPATYKSLMNNICLNQLTELVSAINIGLGSEQGKLNFTKSLDTMNHIAKTSDKDVIEVPIDTLDNITHNKINTPCIIKIDVEGFETEVLKGADNILKNENTKAIIIELNGSGIIYGYDETAIHEKLILFGYKPFIYKPFERHLIPQNTFGTHNTIYIKDLEFVKQRLATSRKFKILDKEI